METRLLKTNNQDKTIFQIEDLHGDISERF